jgi:hypothetical protein
MDIFGIFDLLFTMRLVEKISRPIENQKRMTIVEDYHQKFNELHAKLEDLKRFSNHPANGLEVSRSQKNE